MRYDRASTRERKRDRDKRLRVRLTNGMTFLRVSSAAGLLPVICGRAKPAVHGKSLQTKNSTPHKDFSVRTLEAVG